MKAKHLFYTLFIFLFSLTSCENEANIDYVPTVLFNFEGGTNLVTTPKGIKEYTVKGSITSTAGLTSFVISTANAETGAAISVIESTRQTFDEPKSNYDFSYTITNLSENKAIKISVTDAEGEDFQKSLLLLSFLNIVIRNWNQLTNIGEYSMLNGYMAASIRAVKRVNMLLKLI